MFFREGNTYHIGRYFVCPNYTEYAKACLAKGKGHAAPADQSDDHANPLTLKLIDLQKVASEARWYAPAARRCQDLPDSGVIGRYVRKPIVFLKRGEAG